MSEFEANPEFTKLLEPPREIDLVQVMLELAEDAYPSLDRIGCLLEIDRLGVVCSDHLSARPTATVHEQLEIISHVLYDMEGFHGNRDDYYAPENSYLNEVLAHRHGIPISLGILYMAVAARSGLRMFGVNTPGHFVVGCCDGKRAWYVDPFNAGDVLDRRACQRRIERALGCKGSVCDEHFQPAPALDIVARVLRNLKAAYANQNCWSGMLSVQRRLAVLLPQVSEERRDLALVYLRVGQPVKALKMLEDYLGVCCCEERDALRPSIQTARRMVAELQLALARGRMPMAQQARGQRQEARGRRFASDRYSLRPVVYSLPFDWSGRRVTLMGLGRHGGGVAAARYLAGQGARVTVSDSADRATLAESLRQLEDVPIAECRLGRHDEADFHTEFVVVNPAIRPDHPCLGVARRAGARLISETELFLNACPARVIGVTGSNGKSTASSMLAAILSAAGFRTWLGGNIGRSLLGDVDGMTADDWVVLELSSFQLAHLSASARLPEMAIVTNLSPNHLDWHGSFAEYAGAKQRLLTMQPPGGFAVVNEHDPVVARWPELLGCATAANWPLEEAPPLRVPGEHNRHNAACAAAAAGVLRVNPCVIRSALANFRGLPHRLELVAEISRRRLINDSKSTSPAATIAALEALDGSIWLIAGGHSKGGALDALAGAIVERTRGAAVFGAARDALRDSIHERDSAFHLCAVETLHEALAWCWRQSSAGDAIVLSPACASHDQFLDFEHRGETFRALAGGLAARETS